jgi:predicted dehydrogenase
MNQRSRRDILKGSMAAGLAWGLPRLALGEGRSAARPSAEVRMAIVGLGGIDTVGGVGGRGRQLIDSLRRVAGVNIVALCDVDRAILDHGVQLFKQRGQQVFACADLRKVLDDKTIDAVAVATPNHWHALATVWACQAGKDVYVEKPFSYNIWEGRQAVAAARKHGRMVQVGTQSRSSTTLRRAFEYLHSGAIGPIRYAHAIIYRPRLGIGKAGKAMPVPASVDYDLWCGPAPKTPLACKQLHYDWHWFWRTGNGEIGNNGPHVIDICRWALRQDRPAPRAMSIGGRFGFHDDGETPNTQIALFDYQPAPLICEIRNLSAGKEADAVGKFRGTDQGMVIDCEGGYLAGDASGTSVFDHQGKKIKEIRDGRSAGELEIAHLANFVAAVRTRNAADLNAEALQGHRSAACSHMANISYRLGKRSAAGTIREAIRSNPEWSDAFDRCRDHLRANGVDLGVDRAVVGPWVTLDHVQGRFVDAFADHANELSQRAYREPFVVPEIA